MAAPKKPNFDKNLLFYGDNLSVMREWLKDESIDLIYLDPPFNSKRTYNVLFKHRDGQDANAQITAFDDTWTWSKDDEVVMADLLATGQGKVPEVIEALHRIIGPSDMLSYLVMMTVRLTEMRRVLKPTGTLYLHCDPTASHYVKVVLDAIFGGENFANEIIWTYKYGGRSKEHFGKKHDVILRYTKRPKGFTFNSDDPGVRIPHEPGSLEQNYRYVDEDGRRYREGTWKSGKKYRYYADEGRLRDDVWTDINSLHQADAERLGYPTQKPLALLELILRASSNPGDVVLDPFCGCGTAVDAAHRLGRRWIGIDVSYLAIDLVKSRLLDTYGDEVLSVTDIVGVPQELEGAAALFARSPLDFERWAVSLVKGTPNEKQVGDGGVDGVIRFPVDGKRTIGRVIVSVKGGAINPGFVRDLSGTVSAQKAEMGVLVCLKKPTAGMLEAAAQCGEYEHPTTGNSFPKVQVVEVSDLLAGKAIQMPTPFKPYSQAERLVEEFEQPELPTAD